ncbi:MAG: hypothetical protein C4527_08270 [Candidatus Omnitrophota bacterium]|nr:MAG: hypothetical protein C4527_08270 [Candidatus Omnitrophota bacterium]
MEREKNSTFRKTEDALNRFSETRKNNPFFHTAQLPFPCSEKNMTSPPPQGFLRPRKSRNNRIKTSQTALYIVISFLPAFFSMSSFSPLPSPCFWGRYFFWGLRLSLLRLVS